MALRDQPYMPLYVQDVLTDEKLLNCSAIAHGIYLRLLCILHKQETYGILRINKKYKIFAPEYAQQIVEQNVEQIVEQMLSKKLSKLLSKNLEQKVEQKVEQTFLANFSAMLERQMPFTYDEVLLGITELYNENVLYIDANFLAQKRMVRDGYISEARKNSTPKNTVVTAIKKQYGASGYIYIMSDGESLNKIGVSKSPQNRLYRIRSDFSLPKHFELKIIKEVTDMGFIEDEFIKYFSNLNLDLEWVKIPYKECQKHFEICLKYAQQKVEQIVEHIVEQKPEDENESNISLSLNPEEKNSESKNLGDKNLKQNIATQKFLVVEMTKKYYEKNPTDLADEDEDMRACWAIAKKLEKAKGWADGSSLNGKYQDTLNEWDKILEYSKGDNFFKKFSLKNIENQFQSVWKGYINSEQKEGGATGKVDKSIIGLEFLEDFTKVRLTDGSIFELGREQVKLAKTNNLIPKEFFKGKSKY